MKEKVLLAMSGGIDSSISAILLKELGYEIIGVTLRTCNSKINNSSEAINAAKIFARYIDIRHVVIDVAKKFNTKILNYFYREYTTGRTPNPCVICNKQIKWNSILSILEELECQKIATGHYAKVRFENNRYVLSKGTDLHKDQSYVLSYLTQKQLSKTIFPLANYSKIEIKNLAKQYGLNALVEKSESYELCFIPDDNYKKFLYQKNPNLKDFQNGEIILENGKIVGKHNGYPFYTIGQRKGLNVALGYPVYVIDIIPKNNQIIVGKEESLYKKETLVDLYNVIKYDKIPFNQEITTKIRYNDCGTSSILKPENSKVKVSFKTQVKAITPGQMAVFYEKNDVLGSGYILN